MNSIIKTLSLIISIVVLLSFLSVFTLADFEAPEFWGERVVIDGKSFYVNDKTGKTGAEVTDDICWLQESSDGSSTWYGLDNSNRAFPYGSLFWVDWVTPADVPEYFNAVKEKQYKMPVENETWFFRWGVTDPNGNDFTKEHYAAVLLIQLDTDWEIDDVKAAFINAEDVEVIDHYNIAGSHYRVARVSFPGYSERGGYTAGSFFTSGKRCASTCSSTVSC